MYKKVCENDETNSISKSAPCPPEKFDCARYDIADSEPGAESIPPADGGGSSPSATQPSSNGGTAEKAPADNSASNESSSGHFHPISPFACFLTFYLLLYSLFSFGNEN